MTIISVRDNLFRKNVQFKGYDKKKINYIRKILQYYFNVYIKVTVDHARNPKASTGNFELIYKERQMSRNSRDKCSLLAINGINYFSKYRRAPEKDLERKNSAKEPQKKDHENGIIQNVFNIDPDQVKKDVKNTLEKILSIIHVERGKRIADQEQRDYQSQTFKSMLSEFVTIISSGVPGLHRKK